MRIALLTILATLVLAGCGGAAKQAAPPDAQRSLGLASQPRWKGWQADMIVAKSRWASSHDVPFATCFGLADTASAGAAPTYARFRCSLTDGHGNPYGQAYIHVIGLRSFEVERILASS